MNLADITPDKRSECSLHIGDTCGYCSTSDMIQSYRQYLKLKGQEVPESDERVIKTIKKYLGVKRESHIFTNTDFISWYGFNKAQEVRQAVFKPIGPANSIDLLSNLDIDAVLGQWARLSQALYGKKLCHIPYQMIDFDSKPGNILYNLQLKPLIRKGYDCIACVLNTDVSSGGGKHWFCIYIDLEHAGTTNDPIQIEFFNSSGNPPVARMSRWIDNLIESSKPLVVKYKRSTRKKLQYSRTECGVWCLTYIKARLQDMSPEWFRNTARDKLITAYRQHIFADKIVR